jgi:hypothetical protein
MYIGLFELESTLDAVVPITIADVPVDPAASPTYRIYEGDSLIANGTGTLTQLDTGVVTGATNASPIVITSVAHGLQTGNVVTIKNITGNTAANGTFTITRTGADTFSLDGSTGNAPYTAGGVWHVTGVYLLEVDLLAGSGFDVGKTYTVVVNWTVSSDVYMKTFEFSVT